MDSSYMTSADRVICTSQSSVDRYDYSVSVRPLPAFPPRPSDRCNLTPGDPPNYHPQHINADKLSWLKQSSISETTTSLALAASTLRYLGEPAADCNAVATHLPYPNSKECTSTPSPGQPTTTHVSESSDDLIDAETDSLGTPPTLPWLHNEELPPLGRQGGYHQSKRKSHPINSIHLLAVATGRPPDRLNDYTSRHRCRLLTGLIREAKSLNHSLLRLNNEMWGEWSELYDQRVNLSMLFQHLGLKSSSSLT